jgi:hypothetical protein
MRIKIALTAALLAFPGCTLAQDSSGAAPRQDAVAPAKPDSAEKPKTAKEPEDRVKSLEEQVRLLADQVALLRGELQELREAKSAAPAGGGQVLLASARVEPGMVPGTPPAPAAPQASQTQTYGGATGNAKLLNPDISMIGDFIATGGKNRIVPSPGLEMHESEIGVQAIIDPYARGDFFLSFGEQGVNVEEGYITFTSLPGGFVAKVGKMRAEFGKVNRIHNHALSYIDRPLATVNLVGGEDGINDAGFSLTRILPAPKGWFLEGTAEVFRGDSGAGALFVATHRRDVSTVEHLRVYKDLSESTNVDIGFSYARGHNNVGSDFLTNLYGADATLRWKPLRRAIYHSVVWRSEFFWSHRDQLSSASLFQIQRAFGLYSSLDYRANRRWTVGGRFDRSGRATNASLTDTGFSAILTYWPSEFSQIRGQYRFGHYAEGIDANEVLLQFIFVLGAHGAHPF